ncbi:MAG: hypothetical protein Q9162_000577 [Coniocarpon cinnabarinum]
MAGLSMSSASGTPRNVCSSGGVYTNSASVNFPQWERLIPGDPEATPLHGRLSWFFAAAEKLVEQDEETRQSVIARLATECGLARIREATLHLEAINSENEDMSDHVFTKELMPLLRVLSRLNVMSSLLLENPRDTIINFLSGVGGSRGKSIFNFACQQLQRKQSLDAADTATNLEACVIVVAKILDLSTVATLSTDYAPIFESLQVTFHACLTKNPDLSYSRSPHTIQRIAQRLGRGAEIIAVQFAPHQQLGHKNKPIFEMKQDPPGDLSDQGRRHNNDFIDIENIEVLPTASELRAQRTEYLPASVYSPHCESAIQGLLDKQFRLLREDTVGQLREGVKFEYERRNNVKHIARRDQQAARTFAYYDAILHRVTVDQKHGVLLGYDFTQPDAARGYASIKDRKEWWLHSKRLQQGAITCLIDARGSPLFCTVVDNGCRDPNVKAPKQQNNSPAIFENQERAYITLSLVDISRVSLGNLLDGYIHGHSRGSDVLIEFPGVLLQAFQPSLQALQQMSCKPHEIPFSSLLACPSSSDKGLLEVKPPAYILKSGFSLDLSCLLSSERQLQLSSSKPFDLAALQEHTSLDAAQAESLKYALTHRIALIQGPPGTGKSYLGCAIMKVLTHNARAARLGPLICVTYTNHALDQILEHCHASGIRQIIRIGSQSKSETLESVNLREVVKNEELTRTEKQVRWDAKNRINESIEQLNHLFLTFHAAQFTANIRLHLQTQYPNHFEQLFGTEEVDAEGFQVVGPNIVDPLDHWLRRGAIVSDNMCRGSELLHSLPLHSLNRTERRILYHAWIRELRQDIKSQIWHALVKFKSAREDMEIVRREQELRCLRQAQIVGMTTSGMARVTSQLKHLNAKVVIMEEAGEVLEAHTLVTMLPSVEHAIFIGDHQQLRPQAQNYDLSVESSAGKQYAFDVSLFERLVAPMSSDAPSLPKRALSIQRRMHPSISELVRETLYPQLEDAAIVSKYPAVTGMRRRLFWFDHKHEENHKGTDMMATSHSNKFEVSMTVALVSHLMSQGTYDSRDVAVLTPYLGQLRKLRAALSSVFSIVLNDLDSADLEKEDAAAGTAAQAEDTGVSQVKQVQLSRSLRIATVDNFQGEEAKCVVVSLVRSNENRKCGFLKTTNRINVLLSRAQHGMYLIGDSETYSNVPMWSHVIQLLSGKGNLGTTIELCCPRHPDTSINVTCPDDFATLAPEETFCQICASNDVKSQIVDFLEGNQYADIVLDDDSCLFPQCGHILTRSSMDGTLGMHEHYDMDGNGNIQGPKASSEPFSTELKRCPACRGSLRSISRYGRIVRRALLDESTKRLIAFAQDKYTKLQEESFKIEDELSSLQQQRPIDGELQLQGSRNHQYKNIARLTLWANENREALTLRDRAAAFVNNIRKEEQPYYKVKTMVNNVLRRREEHADAPMIGMVQFRHYLLGSAPLLRLDLAILSSLITLKRSSTTAPGSFQNKDRADFIVDFSRNREECTKLVVAAQNGRQPRQEAEGSILLARYAALEAHVAHYSGGRAITDDQDERVPSANDLRTEGLEQLDLATEVCETNSGCTRGLQEEIDATRKMLNSEFYQPVSNEERRQVLAAMKGEFLGTGHWYTCVNGRPFTIGECGRPMEETRCPQCGAHVGGRNHELAQGVEQAHELNREADELSGAMGRLDLG